VRLLRDLIDNPQTVVTSGTTYDNRANLAPAFFSEIVKRYEGTRLGRQELLAELLSDNPAGSKRRPSSSGSWWLLIRP
jgi:phage terminase large subunit-like protein